MQTGSNWNTINSIFQINIFIMYYNIHLIKKLYLLLSNDVFYIFYSIIKK